VLYRIKTVTPSNSSFGYFFSLIFFVAAFFVGQKSLLLAFFLLITSFFLIVIAFKSPVILALPNKLWFRFGVFLGHVLNPIVLGLIYFLIFTPLSIFMRVFRRDELKIRQQKKLTYWTVRMQSEIEPSSFLRQF
jgi:hypothetical protein